MAEKGFVSYLLEWHSKNRRSFPWRDQDDPYKVFVAEFFLQKTPSERVAKLFSEFIKDYPDIKSLSRADPSEIITKYNQLGLYKRIYWLIKSIKIIDSEYHSKIPSTKNQLEDLPGIGDYTASAILCFAFNQRIEIVDANVIRLYNRVFNTSKEEVKEKARNLLPHYKWREFNEALLDFASLVCGKKANCSICSLNKKCEYNFKDL